MPSVSVLCIDLLVCIIIHFLCVGRLSDEDISLFRPTMKKRQADQDPEHIPLSFNDLDITPEVVAMCEGVPSCIFDTIATGIEEVGMIALENEKEGNATTDALGTIYIAVVV